MRLLATDPAQRPDMHRASQELATVRTTRPGSTSGAARRPTQVTASAPVDPTPTGSARCSIPRADRRHPVVHGQLPDGPAAAGQGGLLTGAVLAVLVFTGVGALLSEGSSGQQGAQPVGQAGCAVGNADARPTRAARRCSEWTTRSRSDGATLGS